MAGAATVGHGGIVGEGNIEEKFTKKKHAARMGNDELMVAANPPNAGPLGPITLEDGGGIAKGAVGEGMKDEG